MNKIKVRDLLVILDENNKMRFGFLNNDKTKIKMVKSGEILPVAKGLEKYYWNLPYVDIDELLYAYTISKEGGKDFFAYPMVLEANVVNSFNEYRIIPGIKDVSLILEFMSYCLEGDANFCGYDKKKRTLEAIIGYKFNPSFPTESFVNENRNKYINFDRILKIENALDRADSNVIDKKEAVEEAKMKQEDEEDYCETLNF